MSDRLVELLVTENKSKVRDWHFENNCVRVFIDRDYNYGFFINEKTLVDLLSEKQQDDYFNDVSSFIISIETANKIIDKGWSYYKKVFLK